MEDIQHPIILFDGVCNLCNTSVQGVLRNDPDGLFRFAPLSSEFAQHAISERNIQIDGEGSLVLLEGEHHYLRSSGALRIARKMRWPWNWLWVFIIVPKPIRDMVYRLVANNRYKWFGKQESCMVPTADVKARFLD